MNKSFKIPVISKKTTGPDLNNGAGSGWHIAGLWTFLLVMPVPYLLHRFAGMQASQISMILLALTAGLLVIQFEAFRRSNGILRPIALVSMLFYGIFLFNMLPK